MPSDPRYGPSSADVTLVGTGGGVRADTFFELPRGTLIGRYVVLDKLGAGGMGVVFAAYDPELDRKVAIKVLVPGPDSDESLSGGRARLLREAQALAKLSHPNVVAIHDVGTVDERVWLAMEFVEGATFGAWLGQRPRKSREIVHVLVAAGRGLAAAHAKGMLHRDFKPDNIMVGRDGRVRVMDFGLARSSDDVSDKESSALYESAVREARLSSSGRSTLDPRAFLSSQVTRAGALLGTPAYLAPEVFRGDGWGPSADQFAFCVTLWEALYGERPFDGDNLFDLATNVMEGNMRPPPRGRSVPGWLRRVCAKGLAVDTNRRYRDMSSLLSALETGAGTTRPLLVGALGVAAAITVFGGRQLLDQRAIRTCLEGNRGVQAAWNPARRRAVEERLSGIGSAYAEDTSSRVTVALDDYQERWTRVRRSLCEAATASDPIPTPDQAACFDGRIRAMSTLVDRLETAELGDLRYAVAAAVELPTPDACHHPPTGSSSDDAALDDRLISSKVLLAAGRLDDAASEATVVLEAASPARDPRRSADARYVVGVAAQRSSEFAEAEVALETAYFEALSAMQHETAARSALALAHLHAVGRVQFELGELWLEHARIQLQNLGREDPRLQAEFAAAAAALATERADYDQAEAHMRDAIALLRAGYGDSHPDIGLMYGHLAEMLDDAGKFAEAESAGRRGLELLETTLGPSHPDNAQALFAIATAQWKRGHGREALELSQQVLELRLAAFGPDDVSVAEAYNSLGNAHIQMGDWRSANDAHAKALAIRKAKYGPDEPRVATSLVNLADVGVHAGRLREGIEYAKDSLRIWEEKLGVDHAYCAYAHIVLGEGYLRTGDHAEALEAFDRALEIRRAGKESEHQLAEPLTGRGAALLALGRHAEALEALEAAWTIRQRNPSEELHAPDTGFVLARALWDEPASRTRAHELAEQARAGFERVKAARPEGLAAVEAWLETHPLEDDAAAD